MDRIWPGQARFGEDHPFEIHAAALIGIAYSPLHPLGFLRNPIWVDEIDEIPDST